jgi:hypothetical protein
LTSTYTRINTGWKQFRNTLDSTIKINPNIKTTLEITEITKFTTALIRARNKHSKYIKINQDRSTIPDEILEHIRSRNKTRKLYQRTGNNTYKIQLQNLNRTIKTQLTQHKNERWENILKKATTKDNSLWKIAKSRTKKRSEISPHIDTNTEAISDTQKSECLASHFQQVHNNNFANNTEHTGTFFKL